MASSITFEPDRLRQARQLALMTKREVAEKPRRISRPLSDSTRQASQFPAPAQLIDSPAHSTSPSSSLPRADRSRGWKRARHTSRASVPPRRSSGPGRHPSPSRSGSCRSPSKHTSASPDRTPGLVPRRRRPLHSHATPPWRHEKLWGLGTEPVGHLVSQLEARGIVCAMAPPTDKAVTARIDAYSTLAFRRPLVVLTADRADDVLRHRFSAARNSDT